MVDYVLCRAYRKSYFATCTGIGITDASEFRICYRVWVDKVTRPDEEGAILPPTRHTPVRPQDGS
jgi:hypothetical protein